MWVALGQCRTVCFSVALCHHLCSRQIEALWSCCSPPPSSHAHSTWTTGKRRGLPSSLAPQQLVSRSQLLWSSGMVCVFSSYIRLSENCDDERSGKVLAELSWGKKKKALGAKYRSDSAWSSLFLFIHTHLILKRISTFQGSVHKGENNGLKKLKIATEQRQGN